VSQTHI